MKDDLGFYVVPFTNLSATATTRLLSHICEVDSNEQCCLFVAVFAAGTDICFKDSDNKDISFQETRKMLDKISDKPKVFFFHIKSEEAVSVRHTTSDKQPLIIRSISTGEVSSIGNDVFQVVFTHSPSHRPTFVSELVRYVHRFANNTTSFNDILHTACQDRGEGHTSFCCPARKLYLPLINSSLPRYRNTQKSAY